MTKPPILVFSILKIYYICRKLLSEVWSKPSSRELVVLVQLFLEGGVLVPEPLSSYVANY
jgi:hypothetical protein